MEDYLTEQRVHRGRGSDSWSKRKHCREGDGGAAEKEQLEAKVQALTAEQITAAFRTQLDLAGITIVKAGDFK